MNALLLACDTLAVKVIEATNAAAVIVEKTKNCCDVKITEKICCAIVTVAGIAAGTILLWHLIQKIANGCKHIREIAKEKEENRLKTEKEYQTKALDYIKDKLDSGKSVNKKLDELITAEKELLSKIEKDYYQEILNIAIEKKDLKPLSDLVEKIQSSIDNNKSNKLEEDLSQVFDKDHFEKDGYLTHIKAYMNALNNKS